MAITAGLLLVAGHAFAVCVTPNGVAGQVIYNTSYKVMQLCNGSNWYNLSASNPGGGGGNCGTAGGVEGKIIYNTSINTMQYCNGDNWMNLGTPNPGATGNCTNPPGVPGRLVYNTTSGWLQYCNAGGWRDVGKPSVAVATPDTFSFIDLFDQNLGTVVNSNIVQISGLAVPAAASASGASSQIRSCTDPLCNSVATTWGSSLSLANNQYIQARQTTSASPGVQTTATIVIGTGSSAWTAATLLDTTPDSYSFTNLTNQTYSTQVTSNIIQITGISSAATAAASGASSQIRVCADSGCSSVLSTWGTSMSVSNNQYLQARQTTAGSGSTVTTATITVGTGTTNWTATTQAPAYTFIATTGGSTWVVPAGVTSVRVDCIGAGGGTNTVAGTYGGGGGAWSRVATLSVVPGATVYANVGASAIATAGGDTWINTASNAAPSSASQGCMAKGGLNGIFGGGGTGGQASSSIGDSKSSGGNGGVATNAAGGGGAGGPNGNGNNGGNSNYSAGGSADAGFGGAGGTASGGAGGAGTEYDASHGSGGGAGGYVTNGAGGAAGLYGGGSGGSNKPGAKGLIAIYY